MRGWHQLASVFTQSGISLNVLCSALVLPNTRDEQNCYVLEQRALEGEERSWSIICLSTAVSLLPTSFLPQSAATLFKPQYPGRGFHWYIFDTRTQASGWLPCWGTAAAEGERHLQTIQGLIFVSRIRFLLFSLLLSVIHLPS